MPKKGKKKSQATRDDLDVKIVSKMEIIYEDTKSVIGIELEFKWGNIYQMIKDKIVPYAGLEYISLYVNIKRSSITKVATFPNIFSCS